MEGTNAKNLRFTKLATEFFPDSFFSEKCPSHSSKFKNCARMFAETHVIELTAMSVFSRLGSTPNADITEEQSY